MLIDLWVIRRIREMKKINELFAKKRISNILQLITGLRESMGDKSQNNSIADKYFAREDEPLNVFQRNRYIGVYINEIISLKRILSTATKKFYTYDPQDYFEKNNSYRNINS